MFREIIIVSSLFLIGCGGGSFSDGLPTQPIIDTQSKIYTPTIIKTTNMEDDLNEEIIESNLNSNSTNLDETNNSSILMEDNISVVEDSNDSEIIENNSTIVEYNNNTVSTEDNTTVENNSTIKDDEVLVVENNDTRPNIILVHGLNDGASAWNTIAPRLSNYMEVEGNISVEVGLEISINEDAKCFDGAVDAEILCSQLSDIVSENKYRSIANDRVFGLKKGDYNVTNIEYRIDNNTPNQNILQYQKVFAINFSNSNQLSFDAQGYELKKIIDDISLHTGIDNFILIGHSMGGLAIRAYIQNEEHKIIEKVITLNTPHLGGNGGIYNEITKNAGVNLANDSKSYQILNSTITDKYDNIKIFYFGYSGGVSGEDDNLYFSKGDDVVDIGSQMGLNIQNSTRIIFSPDSQTFDTYQYISTIGTKEWNDISIEINRLDTLAHNSVLQDKDYIYMIIDIIKNY